MEKNLQTYNSKAVVEWYNNAEGIMPVEKSVFETYKALIAGAALLDIGIGGGRTTAYLMDHCKQYTGIDYAKGFITTLKKKYPQADLLIMDARDLSAYADNSFEFVNFSFNGIDYVDPEGRKKILAEINRVLKPGGIFFFSTHNRAHGSFNEWPWLNKTIPPLAKLKTFIKLLPFLNRKVKNKKQELVTDDFALINDPAHNYSLITFYTTPGFLREQLTAAHFTGMVFYNKSGNPVADDQLDDWIYATAVKR